MTARLSIGIAAAAGPDLAARLAPAVEYAGFHALWVNDTPGADALEVLAAAAGTTDHLVLATGVLPVDRRPAAEIADRVEALDLPLERLVLGVGSGARAPGAVERVRDAVAMLREAMTVPVMVGALGPKMRRAAAEASDGVLLSWLTPGAAAAQAAEAHDVAPSTHAALYVRTATDPRALDLLRAEARRYGGYPAYAANFARLSIDPEDTVLTPSGLGEGIGRYRSAVDEVVLRAIVAEETAEAYLTFLGDITAVADPAA